MQKLKYVDALEAKKAYFNGKNVGMSFPIIKGIPILKEKSAILSTALSN